MKLHNRLIHALIACLVFCFSTRLFMLEKMNRPVCWAICVMGFWLLTPMQVSTVLYTVQRMAQLSCLFVPAGLLRCKRLIVRTLADQMLMCEESTLLGRSASMVSTVDAFGDWLKTLRGY